MTLHAAAFTIFSLAYILLAIVGYARRSDTRPAVRIVLIAIRLLILALLAAAFLRPTLTMQTLAPERHGLAVLVDNSQSMRLFDSDSLRKLLSADFGLADKDVRVFLFGDSLRPLPDDRQPDFSDRRSFFPTDAAAGLPEDAQRILIVSDGNWSNSSLPDELFMATDAHYLRLPAPQLPPLLRLEPLAERIEGVTGGSTDLRIVLSGRLQHRRTITIAVLQDGRAESRRSVELEAGVFEDTLDLRIPARRPGTHLCRIVAETDSSGTVATVVHTVLPDRLRYHIYSARPDLDGRFVSLALQRQDGWQHTHAHGQRPDLLVLLDWDSTAASLVQTVKPRGALLFAGCVPCGNPRSRPVPRGRLVGAPETHIPLVIATPASLPPAEALLECAEDPLRLRRTLLGLVPQTASDTLPLLWSGRYQRHTALVAGVRGFWTWDFMVQLSEEEGTTQTPFSSTLLELTRRALIAGMSDDFLVYPAESPVSESRPPVFVLALPASFDWTEPARVALTITDTSGSAVLDTGLTIDGVDAQHRFRFRSDPLPRGTYMYKGKLRYAGRTFTHADTLRVQSDRTELDIAGQNEQLLAQVARPTAPADSAAADGRVMLPHGGTAADAPGADRATIARTIRIEQSWLLLAALLALLFAEWVIRRRVHID